MIDENAAKFGFGTEKVRFSIRSTHRVSILSAYSSETTFGGNVSKCFAQILKSKPETNFSKSYLHQTELLNTFVLCERLDIKTFQVIIPTFLSYIVLLSGLYKFFWIDQSFPNLLWL